MQRFVTLAIFVSFLMLTRCNHQPGGNLLPFFAQRLLDTLTFEKQPVRIEVDLVHQQVYWLNKMGEIYRTQPDGTQVELINQGLSADMGVTFIEDFCIDTRRGCLYFTDLFDLQTGHSAIKKSDLNGDDIETVATFAEETPLRLSVSPDTKAVYYISQAKEHWQPTYHMGTIGPYSREKTLLYTSSHPLDFAQLQEAALGGTLLGSEHEAVFIRATLAFEAITEVDK